MDYRAEILSHSPKHDGKIERELSVFGHYIDTNCYSGWEWYRDEIAKLTDGQCRILYLTYIEPMLKTDAVLKEAHKWFEEHQEDKGCAIITINKYEFSEFIRYLYDFITKQK